MTHIALETCHHQALTIVWSIQARCFSDHESQMLGEPAGRYLHYSGRLPLSLFEWITDTFSFSLFADISSTPYRQSHAGNVKDWFDQDEARVDGSSRDLVVAQLLLFLSSYHPPSLALVIQTCDPNLNHCSLACTTPVRYDPKMRW